MHQRHWILEICCWPFKEWWIGQPEVDLHEVSCYDKMFCLGGANSALSGRIMLCTWRGGAVQCPFWGLWKMVKFAQDEGGFAKVSVACPQQINPMWIHLLLPTSAGDWVETNLPLRDLFQKGCVFTLCSRASVVKLSFFVSFVVILFFSVSSMPLW